MKKPYDYKLFLLIIIVISGSTILTGVTVKEGKKPPGAGEVRQAQKQLDININTFDYSDYDARPFHKEHGVSCELCHKVKQPKNRAGANSCSWCHGAPELMIEFTKDMEPNPHNSPHYGADLECTQCHHQHKESELFCSQCHEFGFSVP